MSLYDTHNAKGHPMDVEKQWAGEFGDSYTARNQIDWRKRVPFWSRVMADTGARSILEVGCNAGWNLTAIKTSSPWTRAVGIDVNAKALRQADSAGLKVWKETIDQVVDGQEGLYEMVFTTGVLIHISKPQLEQTMRDIVKASARWVLAIEYGAEAEEEILYRGQPNMLWKRPYGAMYASMGLRPVGPFYVLGPDQGFDNCTVYLMEKP